VGLKTPVFLVPSASPSLEGRGKGGGIRDVVEGVKVLDKSLSQNRLSWRNGRLQLDVVKSV